MTIMTSYDNFSSAAPSANLPPMPRKQSEEPGVKRLVLLIALSWTVIITAFVGASRRRTGRELSQHGITGCSTPIGGLSTAFRSIEPGLPTSALLP
ncbi:MAG: hypothetical protein LM550_03425 [Candidatus Contendobacter sp.]|jgi:hypothetical protein|nr:hypothetical protein [Gammaproteobacteria bacterium]MCC8992738.1 hypothetical protein [Candidatus Contendobacter sp.]